MDLWTAICSEEMVFDKPDGSGVLKSYPNVIRQLFFSTGYETFADMKEVHEENPNTKVVQLTETQFDDLTGDLYIDQYTSLPKWQVDFDDSEEVGSYTDPEDAESVWQSAIPIADFRYRLVLRHNTTFVDGENDAPTILDSAPSALDLNQYDKTTGEPADRVVVGIELFNKSGVKMGGFNKINQVFYNGNTPTVCDFVNGYATVYVKTDKPSSKDSFRSNHEYRVETDNRQIDIVIKSRTLND